MRFIVCEQGSPEWKAARCGLITASRIVDVVKYNQPSSAKSKEAGFKLVAEAVAAGIKGEPSKERHNYLVELMAERLTGIVDDTTFQTKWLREGRENEKFARAAYEMESGNFIDQHGFCLHPIYDFTGASPDGLCAHGGVEIKCPKSTTHLEWIEDAVVPEDHIPQMLWTMECCELDWLDFVSFDPRMPDDLQLFICRLMRDDVKMSEYVGEVVKLESDINEQIERLRGTSLEVNHPRVSESSVIQPLCA